MSDPKPAGQGGDKKEKLELFKNRDGSPPKEPEAGDTPKGPKPEKPELLPNPYGPDTPPKTDIDISKLPPLHQERFKDDKTPDDEDDITGGPGGRRGDGGMGGPEVLATASVATSAAPIVPGLVDGVRDGRQFDGADMLEAPPMGWWGSFGSAVREGDLASNPMTAVEDVPSIVAYDVETDGAIGTSGVVDAPGADGNFDGLTDA